MCRSISRRGALLGLVVGGLLFAPQAHAQYANRSLGVAAGFMSISGGDTTTGLGATVPIWLEGHLYIENGFDLFLNAMFTLVHSTGNADTTSHDGLIFGIGGDLGVRYLFMEENIRPWLGVYFTGFAVLGVTQYGLVGPGAAAGLDYFFNDSTSLGVRAFFNLYVEFNQPPAFAPGAAVNIAFYF